MQGRAACSVVRSESRASACRTAVHTGLKAPCAVQALAEVCAVCNDARIEAHGGVFRAAGAPTEAALVVRSPCQTLIRVLHACCGST